MPELPDVEMLRWYFDKTSPGKEDILIPHRKKGAPCPCGRKEEGMRMRGRAGYFCPACQKL